MSTSQILENPTMRSILEDPCMIRYIEDQTTSVEKNKLILNCVVHGGLPAYDLFKRVLQDTRHLKLLEDLDNAEKGLTEETLDLWPRITEKALAQCRDFIRQYLDPIKTLEGICDIDTTNGIDKIRIRDIKEQRTSTEGIKLLIQEVEKLGVTGYELLKQVLLHTGQNGVYDDLVRAERIAMNELVTSTDIIEDYIGHRISQDGIRYESSSRHKSNNRVMLIEKVHEMSSEFERRYIAKFGRVDDGFDKQMLKNKDVYFKVLSTIIEDGIHWGRIVGVVTFAGAVAATYEKHGWAKENVVNWTTSFFTKNIELWISRSGGWISLIDFCNKKRRVSTIDNDDDVDDDSNPEQSPSGDSEDKDVTDGSESSMTTSTRSTSAVTATSSQIKTIATHLISIAGGLVMGMMIGKRS